MTIPTETDSTSARWPKLIACMIAMMAIANLQYAWTLFTTDLTRNLHANLDAVQWAFTPFVMAQPALFPITGYLIDRLGPRIIVTLASFPGALGGMGDGLAHALPALSR